jgi:hypothetical protein
MRGAPGSTWRGDSGLRDTASLCLPGNTPLHPAQEGNRTRPGLFFSSTPLLRGGAPAGVVAGVCYAVLYGLTHISALTVLHTPPSLSRGESHRAPAQKTAWRAGFLSQEGDRHKELMNAYKNHL